MTQEGIKSQEKLESLQKGLQEDKKLLERAQQDSADLEVAINEKDRLACKFLILFFVTEIKFSSELTRLRTSAFFSRSVLSKLVTSCRLSYAFVDSRTLSSTLVRSRRLAHSLVYSRAIQSHLTKFLQESTRVSARSTGTGSFIEEFKRKLVRL